MCTATATTQSLTAKAVEFLTNAMNLIAAARELELRAARRMTDATQIDGMDRPEHGRCLIIAHALTHAERLAQQAREIID